MEDSFLKYLHKEDVILNLRAKNKRNAVAILLDRLIDTGKVEKNDKKEVLKAIMRREEMGSTAIGGNIALPHARLNRIKDIVICIAISKDGIDFDSLDEEDVNIIVLLLSNQKKAGLHLKALAYLAKILRDKSFVQRLKEAKQESEVISFMIRQNEIQ